MEIKLAKCTIRSWRMSDKQSLAHHANNRKIWINVRDRFPHPYSLSDAENYLIHVSETTPETWFAIDVEGNAVGAIGIMLNQDVERISAELGYWLGEEYWARGLMTDAVKAMTEYAFTAYNLTRIYAIVMEWNPSSARVLEKAGFTFETRLRRSCIKDGKIIDQLQYGMIKEE